MQNHNPILVVEDDLDLREALCDTLRMAKFEVVEATDAENALEILSSSIFGLIISDVQMPGINGDELLKIVKRKYSETPFVLITAFADVSKAVEAIKNGAADYVLKPFEAEVLIEMANRLCLSNNIGKMITRDEVSEKLANMARRVAVSDATVMISGESGCGKEVLSRYVHDNSERSDEQFCAINCAAIPEQMLESILFGYEKGAFTGAYTSRAGKFEQANHGTLLLDEISEIDITLQAKLLRVLQEKEVERLGGNKNIKLDVRIIATTNRDLKEEVSAGRFREDLYYRLNVFPLHLHPLRERKDDIKPLIENIIERLQPGTGIKFSKDAMAILVNHNWPGNVRELENVIQRALILKTGIEITCEDIVFENVTSSISSLQSDEGTNVENINNGLECDLKSREKEIIIDAVANHKSRREAAEKLGISQRTLRYKLAQFREEGLSIPLPLAQA